MRPRTIAKRYPHIAEVVKSATKHDGVATLFPPQKEAINAGLLDGGSFLLVFGTGSGKTLMGELFALDAVIREKHMAVFVVPLKALASEKYADFTAKYGPLGIQVGMATGDLDSAERRMSSRDIIICTPEKLESMIRHKASWLSRVGALVVDEVHELDSSDRGPTLEVVITRLRSMNSNMRVLGLSATVGNADEVARWLDATLVKSDWRPVPLDEGIWAEGTIRFASGRTSNVGTDRYPEIPILRDTLRQKKQLLVFAASKRSAEAVAKRCRPVATRCLSADERDSLEKVSSEILNALSRPTKQCRALAELVAHGTAFHHAGLMYKQRAAIENAFRAGLIKIVASTPTLAAGVNLPSFRVVIKGHKMFKRGSGSQPISVIRYRPQAGRAGRIAYDEQGESVLMAANTQELKELWTRYIEGEVEPVTSKLSVRPVLRMHILGLVATSNGLTVQDLERFFIRTFYATQYGDVEALMGVVEGVVSDLVDMEFVTWKSGILNATRLGSRVAELYVDPQTAYSLIDFLRRFEERDAKDISYLAKLCEATEMRPLLNGRNAETEALLDEHEQYLDAPEAFTYLYERYLDVFRTALLLKDWINEMSEDILMERYGVAPGDLNYKRDRAEWLMYACSEIARIIELKRGSRDCRKLLVRIKFGVGKELLPLVKLRNVGRVRARRLFSIGIRSLADVRRADPRTLARAVGPGIARSILEQVGRSGDAGPGLERVKMQKDQDDPASGKGAKTLLDFL